VHENHRYRPWFQDVSARRRSDEFGKLHFIRIEHLNATEPAEGFKNQAASGVWLEYGSHLVDMMRSLLGEPRDVHARMTRLNGLGAGESMVQALFDYGDCTAAIGAAWKHGAMTQSSVLLCGDAGEAWYEGTLTRGAEGRLRISQGESIHCDRAISPHDE